MIDHIVYAAADLDAAVRLFTDAYGIAPTPGGRHPGFGTRNALLGLRGGAYVELVGVDPEQDVPAGARPFGLDRVSPPRFVTWCARAARPLRDTVAIGRDAGLDLGEIRAMSRHRPDGTMMSWTLTSLFAERDGGVLPFYIDWGDEPSPETSLVPALTLASLTLVHPKPERIRAILDVLGERNVAVKAGPSPALDVVLRP